MEKKGLKEGKKKKKKKKSISSLRDYKRNPTHDFADDAVAAASAGCDG